MKVKINTQIDSKLENDEIEIAATSDTSSSY